MLLEWLRYTRKFKVHVSLIVYVKTPPWYLKLGLKDDLKKLKVEIVDLNETPAALIA